MVTKRLAVAVPVLTLGLLWFGTRFWDGPILAIPGGPFRSGQIAAAPTDWDFLADRETVQFQTVSPPASRTIWFVVHDGRLFISSGAMTSPLAPRVKRWPHQVEEDNRIILRVDGTLYEQRLDRITRGPDIVPVLDLFERKYDDSLGIGAAEVTEGHTWMYEVVDR